MLGAGLLQLPVIKKAQEMGVYVIAADDDPNAPCFISNSRIVTNNLAN